MPDMFGILMMGKEALLTQQKAVDVTGHNISNVNTPGYTRQRVNLEAREPIDFQPGQMGTGVRAAEIQRIHDRFLGVQITREQQDLGRWEAQKSSLERLEMIFDESTGCGLNEAMSDFWNAWHDLVNNPSAQAERTIVIERGVVLSDIFNKTCTALQDLQNEIDINMRGTVQEINQVSEQIADLNEKIAMVEGRGQNANDFRDQRELLLKDLSSKIDIQTFENSEGNVSVMLRSGQLLVEKDRMWELSTAPNGSGGQNIVWIDSDGNAVDITNSIQGGQIKGWLEVRDVIIPNYANQLNELASGIITEVNALHQNGYGLEDPFTGSPFTGYHFFAGTSAADMAVNEEVLNDTSKVAASRTAGGVPGDNSNAIEIADLQSALTMSSGTASFDDFYNAMIGALGTDVQSASQSYEHQSGVVSQLDNYRESVSGVSLDEEMVNMIKYQHAYEAAATLITTVDEMLMTLINMR